MYDTYMSYIVYYTHIDLGICTLCICTCVFLHEHQSEEFHTTFKLKLFLSFITKQLNLVIIAPVASREHIFPNGF